MTPLLYREKTLQTCWLRVRVVQADGVTPAPFASVTAYKIIRFWFIIWWEIPLWAASRTANFYGYTWMPLEKNVLYRIDVRWTGADGRRRSKTARLLLNICPYYLTVRMPR